MDLFSGDQPSEAILLLSGGLDSGLLLYLICKYYPEMYIITATGQVTNLENDVLRARDIIEFVKNTFPNHNIGSSEEYNVDSKNPYWVKKAEEDFNNYNSVNIISLTNHLQQVEALKQIRIKTGITTFINGTTSNPPLSEMKKYNFNLADPARNATNNVEVIITQYDNKLYVPWINKDKRYIANIYKKENLMNSLYTFTASCETSLEKRPFAEEPCGKCYGCQEKIWGFLNE